VGVEVGSAALAPAVNPGKVGSQQRQQRLACGRHLGRSRTAVWPPHPAAMQVHRAGLEQLLPFGVPLGT
jgi:hypothetical protein